MSTSGFTVFTYPDPVKSRVQIRIQKEAQGLARMSVQSPEGMGFVTYMGEDKLRSLRDMCDALLGIDEVKDLVL